MGKQGPEGEPTDALLGHSSYIYLQISKWLHESGQQRGAAGEDVQWIREKSTELLGWGAGLDSVSISLF